VWNPRGACLPLSLSATLEFTFPCRREALGPARFRARGRPPGRLCPPVPVVYPCIVPTVAARSQMHACTHFLGDDEPGGRANPRAEIRGRHGVGTDLRAGLRGAARGYEEEGASQEKESRERGRGHHPRRAMRSGRGHRGGFILPYHFCMSSNNRYVMGSACSCAPAIDGAAFGFKGFARSPRSAPRRS
jgi:hypothetical protein